MQRMFMIAEKEGDYQGAASIARVLQGFEAQKPGTVVAPDFVELLTADETNVLDGCFAQINTLQILSKSRRGQPAPSKYFDAVTNRWLERAPTLEERKQRTERPAPSAAVAEPTPSKWAHVELDPDEFIEGDAVCRRNPETGEVEWVEDLREEADVEGE